MIIRKGDHISISVSPYTILFICCLLILAHLVSVDAFVYQLLPNHNLWMMDAASIAMKVSTSTTEPNQKMIYRYDSPFFSSESSTIPSALIMLNTPIKSNGVCTKNNSNDRNDKQLSGVLDVLWKTSSYRICADGAANRLYDATVTVGEELSTSNKYLPNIITGDLDSVRTDVLKYYEMKGVSIVRIEDQNFHDLDKSLMAVEKWIEESSLDKQSQSNNYNDKTSTNKKRRAFIYGGFGGRLDQEMGVINALCVWGKKESFQHTNLAVYDEESCAFVVPKLPTKSEIRIRYPDKCMANEGNDLQQTCQVGEGPTCGIIPIMGRCESVVTTGVKWNLDGNMPLEFGGLVSSSNHVTDEVVTLETSSPLLFTTEMIVRKV